MTVTITFTFDTPAAAHAFLATVSTVAPIHEVPAPVGPLPDGPAANLRPLAQPVSTAKPAKPKVMPKVTPPAPRAEAAVENAAPVVVPPAPEPVPPPATPAATVSTALTLDSVRAALRTVFNKPGGTGAQAATALLKKYNATSVSQVRPEDYAAFIKECQ